MAQDLASAIVDLGVGAEKRRQGRRALRQSVDLVVAEILRHARVGDDATIQFRRKNSNDRAHRIYKVERVNWFVEPPAWDDERPPVLTSQDEPTLVQYTVGPDSDQDPISVFFGRNEKHYGAVLLDVRYDVTFFLEQQNVSETCKPSGREFRRVAPGNEQESYKSELHLATDEELLTFANEAVDVVQDLAKSFRSAQTTYARAAEKLAKLSPK